MSRCVPFLPPIFLIALTSWQVCLVSSSNFPRGWNPLHTAVDVMEASAALGDRTPHERGERCAPAAFPYVPKSHSQQRTNGAPAVDMLSGSISSWVLWSALKRASRQTHTLPLMATSYLLWPPLRPPLALAVPFSNLFDVTEDLSETVQSCDKGTLRPITPPALVTYPTGWLGVEAVRKQLLLRPERGLAGGRDPAQASTMTRFMTCTARELLLSNLAYPTRYATRYNYVEWLLDIIGGYPSLHLPCTTLSRSDAAGAIPCKRHLRGIQSTTQAYARYHITALDWVGETVQEAVDTRKSVRYDIPRLHLNWPESNAWRVWWFSHHWMGENSSFGMSNLVRVPRHVSVVLEPRQHIHRLVRTKAWVTMFAAQMGLTGKQRVKGGFADLESDWANPAPLPFYLPLNSDCSPVDPCPTLQYCTRALCLISVDAK
ncbi:hypothetical protein BKA70DRAFT_1223685 [Coprinopsis sp. MPI-PUGE-AT-0042]|nr:hypothetical protein BKA70DRAFT_1223685 [Coprinopsis sp. MPI-PUGE-AT-0042]